MHYAFTEGEVIVQLHGTGPWGITYLQPQLDDPAPASNGIRLLDFSLVKAKQQAAWAAGDYAVIGTTLQIVGE